MVISSPGLRRGHPSFFGSTTNNRFVRVFAVVGADRALPRGLTSTARTCCAFHQGARWDIVCRYVVSRMWGFGTARDLWLLVGVQWLLSIPTDLLS